MWQYILVKLSNVFVKIRVTVFELLKANGWFVEAVIGIFFSFPQQTLRKLGCLDNTINCSKLTKI
jgi:hypothetical protein